MLLLDAKVILFFEVMFIIVHQKLTGVEIYIYQNYFSPLCDMILDPVVYNDIFSIHISHVHH